MAVTETATKHTAYAQLNVGTTSTGNVKTSNVSIGALDVNKWDAQKAMNIIVALGDCLTKQLYSAQHKRTSILQTSQTVETSSAPTAPVPTTLLRKQS